MERALVNVDSGPALRVAPPAPLFAAAVGVIAGIAASQWAGAMAIDPRFVLGAAIAAFSAFFMLPPRLRIGRASSAWRTPVGLAGTVALIGFARDQMALRLPPDHLAHAVSEERMLVRVEGTVVTAPAALERIQRNPFAHSRADPLARFVLEVHGTRAHDRAALAAASGLVRVTVASEGLDVRPGDRVEVTGWLSKLRGPQNPGEPDFAALSRRRGIHVSLSTEDASLVRRLERGSGWRVALDDLRNLARRRMLAPFDRIEDEPARLLDAMVLGQRSSAGQAISQAFLRTGTIHFLSVSGFHVGLLGGVTWFVARRVLRRGPRTAAAATLAILLTYCVIAEPNSPILRATAMGALACVAILIDRPMSVVNWLSASAVGILLISPQELLDGGFQLSFVQVAALLIVVPSLLERWLRPDALSDAASHDADTWPAFVGRTVKRFCLSSLATAFICWLAAIPLTLYHFAQLTPLAAVQSLLISPLVIVVSLLGFLSLLLHAVAPAVAGPIGTALQISTGWLMSAADWLSTWPCTYIELPPPPAGLVWALYVPLALTWRALASGAAPDAPLELPRSRRRSPMLWASALATAVAVAALWVVEERGQRATHGDFVLHVLAVGNGSAAVAVAPSGQAAMFDCGTNLNRDAGEIALRALRTLRVSQPLQFTAISHADSDHLSGLATLVEHRATSGFVCSPHFVDPANPKRGDRRVEGPLPQRLNWRLVHAGAALQFGDVNVEVLWPSAEVGRGWKENDHSLVFQVHAHGRRILLTGDIELRAMRALLDAHAERRIDLRSDVLIAPHHGSLTAATAAFYRAVEPELVIVSSGQERERLKALVRRELGTECRVLTTHECGAISVRIRPDCSIAVRPFQAAGADP